MSIINNKILVAKEPQSEKLEVEYPVPVIRETPLNTANLRAVKISILFSKCNQIAIINVKKTINIKNVITCLSSKKTSLFFILDMKRVKGRLAKIIPKTMVNSTPKLLYEPIELDLVEKPPVATVVIEWHSASKEDKPKNHNIINIRNVNNK